MQPAGVAAASGLQSQLLSSVDVNDVSVRIHGAAVRAKRLCRDRTLCKVLFSLSPSLPEPLVNTLAHHMYCWRYHVHAAAATIT